MNATPNQSTQPRRSASDTESVNTQAGLLHMEASMATASNSDNPGKVAAFTPGPWKVLPDTHRVGGHPNHLHRFVATANWTEDDGDFSVTGEIVAKLTDAPCIAANARLIAASPSLFSALTNLVALVMSGDATKEEAEGFWADAIAALAIAEGGAL